MSLFAPPYMTIQDEDGNPVSGGKLFFYATGTSTPASVYSDVGLTTPLTNPVVADSAGRCAAVYLDPTVIYRCKVTTAAGATIRDVDPIDNPLAALSASDGSTLVGFIQAGTGAVARTVQSKLREIPVTPQDFLTLSESLAVDAGPAIRRALATGKPVLFPSGTYIVGGDPAAPVASGNPIYCVRPPSGSVMVFETGAVIKAKDGLGSWTRIVSFGDETGGGVSGFAVYGTLMVDANVDNIHATNNEHQHGVFFYEASDFYVERIHSINARGDNVSFGGVSDTRGTCDGFIGSIYGKTAGRKNLVFQSLDNVVIGSALLDNRLGGATVYGGTPDATDGNSFDVEPDSFTGAVPNSAKIGSLVTYGAGNDFSAGTTAAQADAYTVDIGNFTSYITSRSGVHAWTQNAITLNIGNLKISGETNTGAQSTIYYAARLNVGRFVLDGACNARSILQVAQVSGNRPILRIGEFSIGNTGTGGIGLESQDGDIDINHFIPRTTEMGIWNRGVSSTSGLYAKLNIERMTANNVGLSSGNSTVIFIAKSGSNVPYTRIGHIDHSDDRGGSAVTRIVYVDSGCAAGLILPSVNSLNAVAICAYAGADKFYRRSGGDSSPGDYVCTGTPEAMITAPIGSSASRTDGGAGTSGYRKESGAGNTGWVGK